MSGMLVEAPGRGAMWEPPATAGSAADGGILNPPPFPPTPAVAPPLEETGDSDEDFEPLANPPDEDDVESCSYGGAVLEETRAGEVVGGAAKEEEEEKELGDNGSGAAFFHSAASESSDFDEAEKDRRFWESCLQS